MTIFHRFCAVFPLLLIIMLLGGCAELQNNPWLNGRQADATQVSSPYDTPAQTAVMPSTPTSQAVKVAILLPLSGQNAAVGQSMLQAAQLAVFDLNADNFELIPRDTGGTAQGATLAAQSALNDGAQLILGPLLADEVRAVKSATSGTGVNVLAFSTDWTIAGGNTYMMGFLPFGQVDRIATYAASRGIATAAVASQADVYGSTAARAFESKAQEKGIRIAPALSDAASYNAVFIPAGGQALASILQRVANKNAQKLGTGLWDDARVASDPQMNGAWFAAPSPSARRSFEQRYAATYGAAPVRIATLAYDASALAITLGKNGSPFNAASLTNPSGFAGVDGILRFSKSGLAERGMSVLEIRNGSITEIDPAPKAFGP